MESIYFEKQEGLLCAQHCLNSLLQSHYFTAVDLARIASDLDEEEKRRMAELGEDTAEYRSFIQQPSGNMDDSGFFSEQVLSKCLAIWGLELIRYGSTETRAATARDNPAGEKAYICNYHEHWFTIRKLGKQWFNLNSINAGPKLLSDTFLALYLAQLTQEGYSIFVVDGEFPQCEADRILTEKPLVLGTTAPPSSPSRMGACNDTELVAKQERDRQQAILLSLQNSAVDIEDEDLRKAIELSLSCQPSTSLNTSGSVQSSVELFEGAQNEDDDDLNDPELQAAVQLSLQTNIA